MRYANYSKKETKEMSVMFEVQTSFIYGWENCWTDLNEDGSSIPSVFKTHEEAQTAIDDYLQNIKDAVANGDMEEEYDPDDLRIVEI